MQTPKCPAQPQRAIQQQGYSRQGGLLPLIPTTCPRPPGGCHITLSSRFHPRLLPLIPVPAAGHRGSPSPSQNPGAHLSPSQAKGLTARSFSPALCWLSTLAAWPVAPAHPKTPLGGLARLMLLLPPFQPSPFLGRRRRETHQAWEGALLSAAQQGKNKGC